MVSSFRALNTLISVRKGSGLVLEWQQGPGVIVAGGDSRSIRLWDAHRECALSVSVYRSGFDEPVFTSLQEISTQSESPLTSLATDPENNMMFIAGFGDGNIKLFDRRLEEGDSVVRVWREHSSWVQGVRWQKGASKDLLSAR
jgi:regulator-associated protein of mTOR